MENIFDTQDELDQYGVWVKTPPQDASEGEAVKETPLPETNDKGPEEASLDSLADGEVSLDEFLTESDSSQGNEIDVSAFLGDDADEGGGDKNFQPDGEISLDAFLDESDSAGESQDASQENYDAPLDIDLSFDDSMPEVQEDEPDFSGDDIDLDSFMAEDDGNTEPASSSDELVDNFDELFNDIEDVGPKNEEKQELPKADTESVDLSEFGVTGEDMEISSVDDGNPEKKEQQDFNLNVDDDGLDKSSEAVGGESADEDISINMEAKEDSGQALVPDENNPYSAPDDDFDIDGLLNSIEDETDTAKTEPSMPIHQSDETTLPQNDNEETQIIVTDPEDDGLSMSVPENAVDSEEVSDFDVNLQVEAEEKPLEEKTDIFADDHEPGVDIFGSDAPEEKEGGLSVEEKDAAPSVETEAFSVDDFMGEEGFSDPSVAEGNRSYSPEELEEQKRLEAEKNDALPEAEEEKVVDPLAEEAEMAENEGKNVEDAINDFAGEVDRENEVIDQNEENDVNLVNQLENEIDDVDIDGDGVNDADLIIDASEGQTSNDDIEDEDFMPNPFFTPLVEEEGTKTPQVQTDSEEEKAISEESEENSEETVAENENKSNNSIIAEEEAVTEDVIPVPIPDSHEQAVEQEDDYQQTKYTSDATEEDMDSLNDTNTRDDLQDNLMNQIASELSTLKEEIKELKLEFDELRKNGFSSGADGSTSDSIPSPEAETGFFSDMDDDDTIALSGDELSNILSSAEFTAQNDAGDANILGSIEEAPDIPDQDYANAQNGLSMEYSEDNLQEPDLNSVELNSDDLTLPEEISVPRSDDLLVESDSDTMAVKSEPEQEPLDQQVDNSITEDNFEYLSEDPNSQTQEDENLETGISEEPVRTVFDDWQNPNEDEASFEEPEQGLSEDDTIEEPLVVEDNVFDQPEPNDSIVDIAPQDDSMEEIPDSTPSAGSSVSSIPEDMKQEIKSVLSYMDQLLESLPEDKIEEFARSEQFATYKKLFNELGLS